MLYYDPFRGKWFEGDKSIPRSEWKEVRVPRYCVDLNDVPDNSESPVRYDKVTFSFYHIKKVVFNEPATVVFWSDGSKTVVKCGENDTFDPEKGLAMAITKRVLGNKGNYYNTLKKWLPITKVPCILGADEKDDPNSKELLKALEKSEENKD